MEVCKGLQRFAEDSKDCKEVNKSITKWKRESKGVLVRLISALRKTIVLYSVTYQ